MPLLPDDDLAKSGGTGFDLQGATTLFWKTVPVVLRQSDREDQHEDLTFRILTGFAKHNHNLRILRIHISSDNDLFFLHSLEVSEEDFQTLKNEQGILVDFASFPGKIITLLDRCISPQATDATRFQAELAVRGVDSMFKILEINDFKQLPHIALSFRPGNDASVKQFLAFRLLEFKNNCQELSSELQSTKVSKEQTQSQLSTCQQQLSEIKEQYSRHLLEVQADYKTQRATAHEESLQERTAVKEHYDRLLQEQEHKFKAQIDILSARVSELDAESRKLRENKYDLDSKVSELSHKLGSAEGSNRSLEEETARLKQLNQQLSTDKHERDIQLNEARAKLIALDEKVQAQTEIIEQQRSRVRELEAGVRQLEGRCSDLRDVAAGHDQRVKEAQAEVVKGNHIIEKLMNEAKLCKEKVRRKNAIVLRQEEELQQREQALGSALKELQGLTQALEGSKAERGSLSSQNAELKAKLDESKQQLQSNEQMIRWLNQQVTDSQLQLTGAAPGSSYSFRPLALTSGPAATASGLPASTSTVSATPAPRLQAASGLGYTASKYSSAGIGQGSGVGLRSSYSSTMYGAGSVGGAASAFKSFAPPSPSRGGGEPNGYGARYDVQSSSLSEAGAAGAGARDNASTEYGGGPLGFVGRHGDATPHQPMSGRY